MREKVADSPFGSKEEKSNQRKPCHWSIEQMLANRKAYGNREGEGRKKKRKTLVIGFRQFRGLKEGNSK